MKKRSLFLAGLITLTMLLSACSASSGMSAGTDNYGVPEAPSGIYGKNDVVYTESEKYENSDSIYTGENNKIIRTAELTIQTTEFDKAVAALNTLTEVQGGYYETAEVTSGGYYDTYASRSGYFVVRIPKENFNAFRDGTGGIGHVYSISENSQDVGESYYDTEARLTTLMTKRDRLLALLEKAEEMEDIITLENALAEVQYEIDMHTATLRKYDSLIDYASFRIRLNEVVKLSEEPSVKESFGSRLSASLKAGTARFGEGVQNFILWLAEHLINVIICAIVLVIVIIVIRRMVGRQKSKKKEMQ